MAGGKRGPLAAVFPCLPLPVLGKGSSISSQLPRSGLTVLNMPMTELPSTKKRGACRVARSCDGYSVQHEARTKEKGATRTYCCFEIVKTVMLLQRLEKDLRQRHNQLSCSRSKHLANLEAKHIVPIKLNSLFRAESCSGRSRTASPCIHLFANPTCLINMPIHFRCSALLVVTLGLSLARVSSGRSPSGLQVADQGLFLLNSKLQCILFCLSKSSSCTVGHFARSNQLVATFW